MLIEFTHSVKRAVYTSIPQHLAEAYGGWSDFFLVGLDESVHLEPPAEKLTKE